MEKKTQATKSYIKGKPISKEALYYSILFSVSFIVGVVILFIGLANKNKGLSLYAGIITPIFLILAITAAIYLIKHREAIYVEENDLVIKQLFSTGRFTIAKIKKITAATNNTNGITTVNVTCQGKVKGYKFKNISKEEIAQLRRVTHG